MRDPGCSQIQITFRTISSVTRSIGSIAFGLHFHLLAVTYLLVSVLLFGHEFHHFVRRDVEQSAPGDIPSRHTRMA